MPSINPKSERQFLRGLIRMLDNETVWLRRYRFISWALIVIGGVCFGIGIWLVGAIGTTAFWALVIAFMGGYGVGCSNLFSVASRQWPLQKRYLDANAIRSDYEKLQA